MIKGRQNKRSFRKVIAVTAICLAGSATMLAQEETGVKIGNVTWATRNVGECGAFTDAPESAGMYYQWNRSAAWSATGDVSGWNTENPSGSKWEDENDPSPTGWRVPTREEQLSLLDTGKVTTEWITQNGVKGRKFTDKATGNSIFLPAFGRREYDTGILNFAGQGGGYWSSTLKEDDETSAYDLHMYLTNDPWMDTHHGNFGFQVRCVAKTTTGIKNVSENTENAAVTGYFDILGRKLNEEPTKGIYIIQYNNGTAKKVMRIK